jgi:nicotinate phosphoribosyltransferase
MIIRSLLDTDLYKLTMMQGVLHQFPWAEVTYGFKCRTPGVDLRPIAGELSDEIDALCTLRFTREELDYLRSLRFIKEDFVQFLRLFHLQRDFVEIDADGPELGITIRGPWLHTILFEVPVLAIVNELHFRHIAPFPDLEAGKEKLHEKLETVRKARSEGVPFLFSDFGTRRRFSRDWQDELVGILKKEVPESLSGTSNVLFAKKHGLTPIGTMAHEWIMAAQALGPRLVNSQKYALEHWAQEYRGDLGIALSDTVGFDAFLHDFDMYFAKLFDGCRHDSGDPFEWGDRLIAHYEKHRIDARTKRAVFSDGLSFDKAVEIATYFQGRIQTFFGIGTNLTNDIAGKPVQIVIKLTSCCGSPVAKISDSPGKQMCNDESYLTYLKSVFQENGQSACG